MDLFIVPADVIVNLMDDPGIVWISPDGRFAATWLEKDLYVISGDFHDVHDDTALNELIAKNLIKK